MGFLLFAIISYRNADFNYFRYQIINKRTKKNHNAGKRIFISDQKDVKEAFEIQCRRSYDDEGGHESGDVQLCNGQELALESSRKKMSQVWPNIVWICSTQSLVSTGCLL